MILELFQEKAHELITDDEFLKDRSAYACHVMTDYVNHSIEYREGRSKSGHLMRRLQEEFISLLIKDSVSLTGFELSAYSLSLLEHPSCVAFVHDAVEGCPVEESEQRFVATRKAWLKFVIEQEV